MENQAFYWGGLNHAQFNRLVPCHFDMGVSTAMEKGEGEGGLQKTRFQYLLGCSVKKRS